MSTEDYFVLVGIIIGTAVVLLAGLFTLEHYYPCLFML
jgi:hypothetical protein